MDDYEPRRIQVRKAEREYHDDGRRQHPYQVIDNTVLAEGHRTRRAAEAGAALLRVERESWQRVAAGLRSMIAELEGAAWGQLSERQALDVIAACVPEAGWLTDPDPAALELRKVGEEYQILYGGVLFEGGYDRGPAEAEQELAVLRREQFVQGRLRPLIAELHARGFSEARARELIGHVAS